MIDFALDNSIVVETDYEAAIQEIDILFNTEQTELLGDYLFGSNFGQFLWDMSIDETTIETYITNLLDTETEYLTHIPFDVHVETIEDDTVDGLFLVEITLFNSNGVKVKTIKNTIK